jgi:hypothetical protein
MVLAVGVACGALSCRFNAAGLGPIDRPSAPGDRASSEGASVDVPTDVSRAGEEAKTDRGRLGDLPPPDEAKPPPDKSPLDKPPLDKPPLDKPPLDKPSLDKPPLDKPPLDKPPLTSRRRTDPGPAAVGASPRSAASTPRAAPGPAPTRAR